MKIDIDIPNEGLCDECGADLDNHTHRYMMNLHLSAQTKPLGDGSQGLGTYVITLCPECMRSFLEQYGIEHPELVVALKVVNQEEANPV